MDVVKDITNRDLTQISAEQAKLLAFQAAEVEIKEVCELIKEAADERKLMVNMPNDLSPAAIQWLKEQGYKLSNSGMTTMNTFVINW